MQSRHTMVCVFVVRPAARGDTQEFLQLRRAAGDYMGGSWQTIYGQAEEGETGIEAALRELREEAGLTPREFYRLAAISSFYLPGDDTIWHCVQFCAIVDRQDEVTLNAEHDAARWVSVADAPKLFMWQDNRLAIEEILRDIVHEGLAKTYLRILPPPG